MFQSRDAVGVVLGEQAAVELLAASVVRLGGQQHPGAVGAGGLDGQLELRAEVGVEGGLAHVAPATVVHPVHRLPAADHDECDVRVVGGDGAAPQAWPVAAVARDALVELAEVPVRPGPGHAAAQHRAVAHVEGRVAREGRHQRPGDRVPEHGDDRRASGSRVVVSAAAGRVALVAGPGPAVGLARRRGRGPTVLMPSVRGGRREREAARGEARRLHGGGHEHQGHDRADTGQHGSARQDDATAGSRRRDPKTWFRTGRSTST